MRALDNADKFDPDSSAQAWLFTMARRLWLNDRRAAKVRLGSGVIAVDEADLAAPGCDMETNILARQVFEQVMALPDAQRATVLLVYVEGHSYQEAADILDIPIGTVMSRLAAARSKIKAQ